MDKIKTVKIKNEDGSISEESYTISVDARNVDMDNGKELQETIGTIDIDTDGNIAEQLENLNNNVNDLNIDIKKKAYFFDTVADMKNANLKVGDYVCTLGYYEVNDGGAGDYQIVSGNYTDDGGSYHKLKNNLYAKLIIKNYVNTKQFGAKIDGSSDDTGAIQNAINFCNNIIFSNGTYLINGKININKHNVSLRGNTYRGAILKFGVSGGIDCIGTSIISGGQHVRFLTIENLDLRSNIPSARTNPFLNLICCAYIKIINCWISGLGRQILMWECFDSRVLNTDVEWGGNDNDSSVYGIELRSTNGGDPNLPSYEYTNNIYWIGCRFESHAGTCIGSTGNNTNKITFESCKFESANCLHQNAIKFIKANSIYFTDCVFAGDISNTKNYVYIDQVNDFKIDGFAEHMNHYSAEYSGKKLFYCAGSGKRIINLQIIGNANFYTIDNRTMGLDTYMNNNNDLFINGDIRVNNISNKDTLITNRTKSIKTLTNGSTDLNYTCEDNGFIYVTMVGTWGQTTMQKCSIKNNTNNYQLQLNTIADAWVSGFLPVSKGDIITCNSNTSATAYVSMVGSYGYKLVE